MKYLSRAFLDFLTVLIVPISPCLRTCGFMMIPLIFTPSGRSGGAILASGIVSLDHCVLEGNQASIGSAITNAVSASLQFVDFINNTLLCDDSRHFLDWNDVSGLGPIRIEMQWRAGRTKVGLQACVSTRNCPKRGHMVHKALSLRAPIHSEHGRRVRAHPCGRYMLCVLPVSNCTVVLI